MAIKHRITINVVDDHGKKRLLLHGGRRNLPKRLLKVIFGDFSQVYLLSPGKSVASVNINELNEGGEMNEE